MQVIDRLLALRGREHATTVDIVEALLECHRSKAHVDLGYANLWVFMIERLGYSRGAASRRLRAVRCAAKFPVVLTWLRERRVNLAALAQIASVLDDIHDVQELRARIEGRSETEVERAVAAARPSAMPREQVKTVFVQAGQAAPAQATSDSVPPMPTDAAPDLTCTSNLPAPTKASPRPAPDAPTTNVDAPTPRVVLKFSFSPEEFAAFERARAILSRKTGRTPRLEECFAEFVQVYLAKKAPREREASRRGSARNRPAAPSESEGGDITTTTTPRPRSRHIPVAVRDAVLLRDGERCTFVGPQGDRCTATHALHVDHVHPFALGGAHELENLRVMCSAHNLRLAEVEFGGSG